MYMWPPPFVWRTIAGRGWPWVLKLNSMPNFFEKFIFSMEIVLCCFPQDNFGREEVSPKPFFDRGGQGCRIISVNDIL